MVHMLYVKHADIFPILFCFQVTSLDVAQGGLGLSCEESSSTIKVWETANATVRVRSCIVIASKSMDSWVWS